MTQPLICGPLTIPFTRVADPERVLDDLAAAVDLKQRLTGKRDENPQHLPYWAELWDSAVGLATFLASHSILSPQTSVLDLGCGMGLAGSVAATLGASVTFADMEPDALLFALVNAGSTAEARQLNWQTDRIDRKFDLIVGADILYERPQWDYLEPFWRAHLAVRGRVLLGEPGRPTGTAFPKWITDRGWSIATHFEKLEDRGKTIRLFELKIAPQATR